MIFKYKDKTYPDYLKDGNALNYILPIAKYFCKGKGLDIGGTQKCHFPGSDHINIVEKKDGYHAIKLPDIKYNFIISSHCLEHLKDPFWSLKYWTERLKKNGVLFLYLPHENQEYWTFDNPRHFHIFTPAIIEGWLNRLGYKDILTSGQDMYWSFTVIGFKK